jgi:hypothetical protein
MIVEIKACLYEIGFRCPTNPKNRRCVYCTASPSPVVTGPKFVRGTWNQFDTLEFLVFVDGSLLGSQVFPSGREAEYPAALASRIAQLVEEGWIEERVVVG